MTTLTHRWLPSRMPDETDVRQVYGFCFDAAGRVLLGVEHGESPGLRMPGSETEADGYDYLATLVRECRSGYRVTITKPIYLGYRQVRDEDAELTYAELFLAARITTFHRRSPALGSCRSFQRLLTPVSYVPDRLGWGAEGSLQISSAAAVATNVFGLDLSVLHDEIYRT
ncbi:NUDIX hydrolase [Streptomyces cupreus]|uniref:NUDIX hydrolase n=1 Tax=Streptomyces cupreus TaxID=2759956 RepID=A0A7X1IZZ9_9ACTN|nr:NUDIX hydrolase [Streptomyces cupreus]MBC2901054.1 NUDIX hydrolase [Streptomyces cupreus]